MRSTVAIVLAVACALVLSAPWTGAAKMLSGDIKKELQTATFHASELAQRGNSVAASKLHLQHVINCLVGDTGSNFKLDAGYPCQGQGNGIIPDLKAAVAMNWPGAAKALKEATLSLDLAVQALAKTDVNEVQPWAKVVADHLKAAQAALGS